MTLVPTLTDRIARARTDLRLGLGVVLSDGAGCVLMLAADGLTDARLASARELGAPFLAVTAWRAETLRARAYDGDIARLDIPTEADAHWVHGIADPKDDLAQPMKGPLHSQRGGEVALARTAVALVKSARLLPAAVLVQIDANVRLDGVTELPGALAAEALTAPVSHVDVVAGRVPIDVSAAGRVHVFRPDDGGDDHVVCEIGRTSRSEAPLVRLHSACFTGDVLGSLKCDCGPQLRAALAQMGEAGAGVLLYLSQEGRGIGLANKLRAYALQDQGFDTVEANHRLGFEDDERDFRTGADLLQKLGFSKVRLMTNNPAKVGMLEAHGIDVVERVPLAVGRRPENADYLDVKARKSGHLL